MAKLMRYATFMGLVGRVGGLTHEEAERAVEATLRTLAERITGGEARDLALFLPRELRPLLTPVPEPAEAFDAGEFVRRVAEREGTDPMTAREHARAVFTALGFAVAPGELRDAAAQLPRDFAPFLEAAGVGRAEAMAEDDAVTRVAELAGIDHEAARLATEATLEALAVRISDGEIHDIERDLPANLRPALERGLSESRAARRMSAEEFVARVAAREGVSVDEARDHVRVVLAVLREYVSADEFHDVTAQLSNDYAPLLSAAG
jgi:uncharacterized protein (DUF2267 family)